MIYLEFKDKEQLLRVMEALGDAGITTSGEKNIVYVLNNRHAALSLYGEMAEVIKAYQVGEPDDATMSIKMKEGGVLEYRDAENEHFFLGKTYHVAFVQVGVPWTTCHNVMLAVNRSKQEREE